MSGIFTIQGPCKTVLKKNFKPLKNWLTFVLDYSSGTGVVIEKGPHKDMCGKVSYTPYNIINFGRSLHENLCSCN